MRPRSCNEHICSAPYQAFPAILLSNYVVKTGLVCGCLSQDVFYQSYEVGHSESGAFLKVYSLFKDIAYRKVQAGETLVDILYIGETENADDINKIWDDYAQVLRGHLIGNEGANATNRHSLIWDSWNDGIFRDVSEEMLIREAKAIKRFFPTVEWFQLDDGYSSYCHENVARGCRWIQIATLAGDISPVDFRNIFVKNIRIIGSTLRSKTPEEKGQLLSELVEKTWCKFESGDVKVKIYKTFPIQEADEAQQVLYRGENVGKVVLIVKE